MLCVTASWRSRASAWRSSAAACFVAWRYRRSISMTAASASPTVRASCCSSAENGPASAPRAMTSAPAGPEVAVSGAARIVPEPSAGGLPARVVRQVRPGGDVLGDHDAVAHRPWR